MNWLLRHEVKWGIGLSLICLACLILDFFVMLKSPVTWFNGASAVVMVWSQTYFWRSYFKRRALRKLDGAYDARLRRMEEEEENDITWK